MRIAGQAICIVAALALCLVAQLAVIGVLAHNRDQDTRYNSFRVELANATAPVGGLDKTRRLLADGTPMAILAIPKLGLREVVGEGTSPEALKSGPGHRRDTVLPGQNGVSVLYGRRAAYGGPFEGISTLSVGDDIKVTTGQGVHGYRVTGVRRAGAPQPVALAKGEGRLTLVTADGPLFLPSDVLRVDAKLTSQAYPTNGAPPAMAVRDAEQQMSEDFSAIVPMVAWGLVLCVAAGGVVFLRQRAGRWHAWVVGVPLLGALGLTVADQAASLLPNLL
ncbi:sortase [Actinocrispum wychmicini]|uniref:LPXTG-site transpeptidase (Sortase) family protein n=1 Tax=Actinocrispum wychmicini TaxID=1213861 RepID=A0A4V6NP09_9PSEU|nr:class E sortase [Actinocrispum wychmicini]TCO62420.1 LPXTG-site transpeptidase (sortase) family protein [Actinocrispum wychmicini]